MSSVIIRFSDRYISKRDNKAAVVIIVKFSQKEKREINTNVRIHAAEWESSTLKVNKSNKNYKDLNLIIENKLAQINNILTEYRLMRKEITAAQFDAEMRNPQKRENFLEFYKAEISERSALRIIDEKTKLQYLSQLNKLTEFRKHINFSDIDEKLIKDYQKHLTKKELKKGTIHNALKTLRIFVSIAYRRKLINENPFRGYKMPGQDSATVFLTKQEVKQLFDLYESETLKYNYNSKEVTKYQNTLKVFLFITQTGLRITEMLTLEMSQVLEIKKRKYIFLKRGKTEEENLIPLSKRAYQLIIEDNKHRLKGLIFQGLPPESKMNKYIKEIAQKAKIDPTKAEKITFHKARHTFATLAITEHNADIKTVSNLLGHKRTSTTLDVYTHLVVGNKEKIIDCFDAD